MDVFLGPTNFDTETIKKNKIKNILVVLVDKPDGSVIIDKGATQGYDFDTDGKLTRYYYTILNNTEKQEVDVPAVVRRGKTIRPAGTRTITRYLNDTIFVNIFYDSNNRMITKRVKTEDYYDAFYYEYNEQGEIKKETHCKETNVSENKKEFKMGVQTILSAETFEYTKLTSSQTKKSCLNDEGRAYKNGVINYDERGNKVSETYEFIVSWMREETSYKYDLKNQLIDKIYKSNQSGEVVSESQFEYNSEGFVLSEKKIKSGVLTDEINYLYDDRTHLVKSEVNRDHRNSSVGIVKLGYTFYD